MSGSSDDATGHPLDDDTTGLYDSVLRENLNKWAEEVNSFKIPFENIRLSLDILNGINFTDVIKTQVDMPSAVILNAVNAQVDILNGINFSDAMKPQVDVLGSTILDAMKPQLDVISGINFANVIKPQVDVLGSTILNAVKPQQDVISGINFAIAMKPQLDVMSGINFADIMKLQLDVLITNFLGAIKAQPDILDSINPLAGIMPDLGSTLNVFSANLLSESLIAINQNFDLLGCLSASIGNIQAWISPNFRRIEEKMRLRVLAAFKRSGLCLAPSMPEDLMYQITWYVERGDLRPVTLLVWRYYTNDNYAQLKQTVSSWWNNPEFAARSNLFEAAFKTHVQKIYEASISILIPQLEGIASSFVRDNVIKNGNNNKNFKLGKTEKVINYMLNSTGAVPTVDANEVGLTGWVMINSVIQYVQGLYRPVDFEQNFEGIRKSRLLHRHSLSHGIQLKYSTAMNSLRLFLLYDSIHHILESYRTNGKFIGK